MPKKLFFVSLMFLLAPSLCLFALSPIDILEQGKRAFELAKWEESEEILERFMETWPEHEKYDDALYFYTLASAKTIDLQTQAYKALLGKKLKDNIEKISKDMPEMDITEAKVALAIAESHNKPQIWEDLLKLNPEELKHYIARGWHPNPALDPFAALKWANTWLLNRPNIEPELKSEISLIKLSGMWRIIQSPLAYSNRLGELESIGCFPINKAFEKCLKEAFANGNPEQKRKASIFGYHFDYFSKNTINTNKKVKSSWLNYLKSRGLSEKDTWSPE